MTPGTWLVASTLLRRPTPIGEPYPHICTRLAGDRPVGARGCGHADHPPMPDRPRYRRTKETTR